PARRRDLVFVSAGLEPEGGGRAAAGRLLADAAAAFARREGIGFRVLALRGPGPGGAPWRGFAGRQAALARAAWRGQLRRRPEAYVFDLLGPARVQALLPSALRAPYLLVLLGIEAWRRLSWDRARAVRGAAALLAISRHTVERARPFCPGLERARVVPLALADRAPAGAADRALLARLGEGFVLTVGRMDRRERYKGHDELLAAMPRLLAAAPSARLVVAGEGDDRPRLAARAAELGLGERVTFTGFVGEATLAELYRRCALFAMPSRGEGFGLVYLEAMRAAKPCLAACGGAAEEVIVEGETGLLVDPADGEALAAALARLLADRELAAGLGAAGRRRFLRDYTAERFGHRLAPHLDLLTRTA
ncbi:MAG TPA: glycosyltransferase family 4 protein, partial [Thermoanaerobaculia bacterium]|nr:glycosyltransferase family 4 protein [Thermoanaerobaculia bacterium]